MGLAADERGELIFLSAATLRVCLDCTAVVVLLLAVGKFKFNYEC